MRDYSFGSIWRKWDLHLHTPSSYDYKNSGITNEDIIKKLHDNNISVAAITDHHTMDIERIKNLIERGHAYEITILPGIELRSELGGSESVHFIGVFSESADISTIWDKLKGTLNLTADDIKKKTNEAIYCDFMDSAKLIHELGGIISIHAGAKSNSVENITNALSHKMAQKRDIVDYVDIYEIGKVQDINGYNDKVFPCIKRIIPMVMCSDNHNITDYQIRSSCWIKANPTFMGLKQILFEPEERVFIGAKPEKLKLIEQNKTKYVDFIRINKKTDSSLDEKWFESIELPINPDLVAIIGKKGSGKSALTDIIGLLGKSQNVDYFSFLHSKKFKMQNCKLAKHFYSSLRWLSGLEEKCDLSDDIDRTEDEKVKYIPQKYFENICNLIETKQAGNEFDKEIKKVIFSHIKDEEKLRKETLDELIKYKTEQIDREIDIIVSELKKINQEIISLEAKNHSEYLKSLESRVKTKQIELEAHDKSLPEEKNDPSKDQELNKKTKRLNNKINNAEKYLEEICYEVQNCSSSESELNEKLGITESLINKLENIEKYIKIELNSIQKDCENLKININEIIEYKIEKQPVIDSQQILKKELKRCKNIEKILLLKKDFYVKKISILKEQLDEPSRQYQAYRLSLNKWEKIRSGIIGDESQPDSIKFIEKEISYLKNSLKKELQEVREKRIEKSSEIYDCLLKKINIYEDLYLPVKDFITHYEQSNKQFSFSAKIKEQGIINFIFEYINKNSKGSFCGDGAKIIDSLLNKSDFNSKNDILDFLKEFIHLLENDSKNNERRDIVDQIKPTKKTDLLTFYQDLFSLKHLQPYYSLCLNNNDISQLSPGEKGTVLLIFYLLIDKHDIPLIIDQPEENLDNESVYEMLVPAIRKAKKRRQIIIVTHNPNLAVVCNAEQIIKASIDKNDKNKVTYLAGSIENFDINRNVVNVLEGTWPAFTNRSSKYFSTKFDESNFDQTIWE